MTPEGLAEVYNVLNISTPAGGALQQLRHADFWQPGGSGDVGTRGVIPHASS